MIDERFPSLPIHWRPSPQGGARLRRSLASAAPSSLPHIPPQYSCKSRGLSSHLGRSYTALWRGARRGSGGLPSPWRILLWRWGGAYDRTALTRVVGDCDDFHILRLGYEIQYRTDASSQGARFSTVSGMGPDSCMWRNYQAVCHAKTPLETDTPYVGPHADFLDMREALFPFGTPDGRVTHVLALVEFFARGDPHHSYLTEDES